MSEPIGVIYDLETTTNKPLECGIVQLAAITLTERGDKEVLYEGYVKPHVPCQPEAEAVHGITPDKYENSPSDHEVVGHFHSLLEQLEAEGKEVYLAGFNHIRFDNAILANLAPLGRFKDFPQIDLSIYGPRMHPEWVNHKLGTTFTNMYPGPQAEAYVKEHAHDALGDVEMVAWMIEYLKTTYNMDFAQICAWLSEPKVLNVCHFGKHKGKLWSEVPWSYKKWIRNNWDDLQGDMLATMESEGV